MISDETLNAMASRKVEVSRDALGWLLVYRVSCGAHREGEPVGAPDYYRTKAAAMRAASTFNKGQPVGRDDLDAAVSAGLTACDLIDIANNDVITRPALRAFLRAALDSLNRKSQ